MLEAAQHDSNSFATLTFRDEDLPSDGCVTPQTLSRFIKRLRKSVPFKIRYFGVGEYGDQSARPHYHLAIFGYPSCEYGLTRRKPYCCTNCERIAVAWGRGNIYLGQLEPASAAYVAGYVVKKYTAPDHPWLVSRGLKPEFARMSLRPGIGLGMMHELASTLLEHKLDQKMIDVPLSLQHGMKKFPLGRYLRKKLRMFIGKPENAPQEVIQEQAEEMQILRTDAWEDQVPLSQKVQEESLGRRRNIYARENIYRKRSKL